MSITRLIGSVALLSLAACYGAAPPRPARIPMPTLVDGAEIDVFSQTHTTMENIQKVAWTCPQGKAEGDPTCVKTTYTVTEPVDHTITTASYGAEPISYGQFKVLTDARYEQKLAALDHLSHTCKRANIPRYAGMALFAVGLLGGPIIGAMGSSSSALITYGGMGAGGLAYGLGYFAFGGRDCNEARAIYNDVNVAPYASTAEVEGGHLASEMKVLAEQFNVQHGAMTARAQAQMEPVVVEPPAPVARKKAGKLRMRR
jgi:hypothetical protein